MKSKGKLTARTQQDIDLEFMLDKNNPNDLVLKMQGKRIVITPEDIRKLFKPGHAKELDLKSNKSAKPETQRDSKFAKDMIDFFKSPAGEKVKSLKKMMAASLVDLFKDQQKQSKHLELKKALYMAKLRLLKIAKRKEKAKKYTESWAKAIEKTLAQGRALIEQNSYTNTAGKASKDDDYQTLLREQIALSYQLATEMCEADLAEKEAKLKEIDARVVILDQEFISLTTRYGLLEANLQALDADAERFEAMGLPGNNKRIQAIEAALAESQAERAHIIAAFHELNATGQHAHANALLYRLDAVDTRIDALNDMRSVALGEKRFYNSQGERVYSYCDATHVVEGKLHQDAAGQLYLLKPGQKFQNMSEKERAEAKDRYENDKQEIALMKEVVKENKKNEVGLHYIQKNEAVALQNEAKADFEKSKENLQQAKIAQASAMAVIANPGKLDAASLPTPLLIKPATPKPAPSVPQEKSEQTGTYRNIMEFMRDVEAMKMNANSEALARVRDRLPNQSAQKVVDLIIRPGEPITPMKMQELKKSMDQLYNKQNVPQQAEKSSEYTSPTPFNITPKPTTGK